MADDKLALLVTSHAPECQHKDEGMPECCCADGYDCPVYDWIDRHPKFG